MVLKRWNMGRLMTGEYGECSGIGVVEISIIFEMHDAFSLEKYLTEYSHCRFCKVILEIEINCRPRVRQDTGFNACFKYQ